MCNLYRILSIVFFIVFFILPISATTVLEVTEDDFVVGDKNAPVTIIEYASLSCSHCANFHNNTLEDLIKEYVDTGHHIAGESGLDVNAGEFGDSLVFTESGLEFQDHAAGLAVLAVFQRDGEAAGLFADCFLVVRVLA